VQLVVMRSALIWSWLAGLMFGLLAGIQAFSPNYDVTNLLNGFLRIGLGVAFGVGLAFAVFVRRLRENGKLGGRLLFGLLVSMLGGLGFHGGWIGYLYLSEIRFPVWPALVLLLVSLLTPAILSGVARWAVSQHAKVVG